VHERREGNINSSQTLHKKSPLLCHMLVASGFLPDQFLFVGFPHNKCLIVWLRLFEAFFSCGIRTVGSLPFHLLSLTTVGSCKISTILAKLLKHILWFPLYFLRCLLPPFGFLFHGSDTQGSFLHHLLPSSFSSGACPFK